MRSSSESDRGTLASFCSATNIAWPGSTPLAQLRRSAALAVALLAPSHGACTQDVFSMPWAPVGDLLAAQQASALKLLRADPAAATAAAAVASHDGSGSGGAGGDVGGGACGGPLLDVVEAEGELHVLLYTQQLMLRAQLAEAGVVGGEVAGAEAAPEEFQEEDGTEVEGRPIAESEVSTGLEASAGMSRLPCEAFGTGAAVAAPLPRSEGPWSEGRTSGVLTAGDQGDGTEAAAEGPSVQVADPAPSSPTGLLAAAWAAMALPGASSASAGPFSSTVDPPLPSAPAAPMVPPPSCALLTAALAPGDAQSAGRACAGAASWLEAGTPEPPRHRLATTATSLDTISSSSTRSTSRSLPAAWSPAVSVAPTPLTAHTSTAAAAIAAPRPQSTFEALLLRLFPKHPPSYLSADGGRRDAALCNLARCIARRCAAAGPPHRVASHSLAPLVTQLRQYGVQDLVLDWDGLMAVCEMSPGVFELVALKTHPWGPPLVSQVGLICPNLLLALGSPNAAPNAPREPAADAKPAALLLAAAGKLAATPSDLDPFRLFQKRPAAQEEAESGQVAPGAAAAGAFDGRSAAGGVAGGGSVRDAGDDAVYVSLPSDGTRSAIEHHSERRPQLPDRTLSPRPETQQANVSAKALAALQKALEHRFPSTGSAATASAAVAQPLEAASLTPVDAAAAIQRCAAEVLVLAPPPHAMWLSALGSAVEQKLAWKALHVPLWEALAAAPDVFRLDAQQLQLEEEGRKSFVGRLVCPRLLQLATVLLEAGVSEPFLLAVPPPPPDPETVARQPQQQRPQPSPSRVEPQVGGQQVGGREAPSQPTLEQQHQQPTSQLTEQHGSEGRESAGQPGQQSNGSAGGEGPARRGSRGGYAYTGLRQRLTERLQQQIVQHLASRQPGPSPLPQREPPPPQPRPPPPPLLHPQSSPLPQLHPEPQPQPTPPAQLYIQRPDAYRPPLLSSLQRRQPSPQASKRLKLQWQSYVAGLLDAGEEDPDPLGLYGDVTAELAYAEQLLDAAEETPAPRRAGSDAKEKLAAYAANLLDGPAEEETPAPRRAGSDAKERLAAYAANLLDGAADEEDPAPRQPFRGTAEAHAYVTGLLDAAEDEDDPAPQSPRHYAQVELTESSEPPVKAAPMNLASPSVPPSRTRTSMQVPPNVAVASAGEPRVPRWGDPAAAASGGAVAPHSLSPNELPAPARGDGEASGDCGPPGLWPTDFPPGNPAAALIPVPVPALQATWALIEGEGEVASKEDGDGGDEKSDGDGADGFPLSAGQADEVQSVSAQAPELPTRMPCPTPAAEAPQPPAGLPAPLPPTVPTAAAPPESDPRANMFAEVFDGSSDGTDGSGPLASRGMLPSAPVKLVTDPYSLEYVEMVAHCQVCDQLGLAVQSYGNQPCLLALYAPGRCVAERGDGGGAIAPERAKSGCRSPGRRSPPDSTRPAAVYLVDCTASTAVCGGGVGGKAAVGSLLGSLRGLLESPDVIKVVYGCEQIRVLEVAVGEGTRITPLRDLGALCAALAALLPGLPPAPPAQPWAGSPTRTAPAARNPAPASPTTSSHSDSAAGRSAPSTSMGFARSRGSGGDGDSPSPRGVHGSGVPGGERGGTSSAAEGDQCGDSAPGAGESPSPGYPLLLVSRHVRALRDGLAETGLWADRPELLGALLGVHSAALYAGLRGGQGRDAAWLSRPLHEGQVEVAAGAARYLPELWAAGAAGAIPWVAERSADRAMRLLRG